MQLGSHNVYTFQHAFSLEINKGIMVLENFKWGDALGASFYFYPFYSGSRAASFLYILTLSHADGCLHIFIYTVGRELRSLRWLVLVQLLFQYSFNSSLTSSAIPLVLLYSSRQVVNCDLSCCDENIISVLGVVIGSNFWVLVISMSDFFGICFVYIYYTFD